MIYTKWNKYIPGAYVDLRGREGEGIHDCLGQEASQVGSARQHPWWWECANYDIYVRMQNLVDREVRGGDVLDLVDINNSFASTGKQSQVLICIINIININNSFGGISFILLYA